jgi:hypothetical protein
MHVIVHHIPPFFSIILLYEHPHQSQSRSHPQSFQERPAPQSALPHRRPAAREQGASLGSAPPGTQTVIVCGGQAQVQGQVPVG